MSAIIWLHKPTSPSLLTWNHFPWYSKELLYYRKNECSSTNFPSQMMKWVLHAVKLGHVRITSYQCILNVTTSEFNRVIDAFAKNVISWKRHTNLWDYKKQFKYLFVHFSTQMITLGKVLLASRINDTLLIWLSQLSSIFGFIPNPCCDLWFFGEKIWEDNLIYIRNTSPSYPLSML